MAVKEQNALPQFVRDQLAREQRQSAEVHPDADILTAFCEGSLTDGERNRVMDHIALCGDCREVVFLSAPETLESAPIQAVPAPRVNWWRRLMPAVAAAAAVVVVGSAVLLNRNSVEPPAAHLAKAPATDTYIEAPTAAPSVSEQKTPAATRSLVREDLDKKVANKEKAEPARTDAVVVGGIVAPNALKKAAPESPAIGGPSQQQITAAGAHGPIVPKGNATNYQNLAVTPAPAPPVVPTAAGKYGPVEAAGNTSNYALNIPGSVRDSSTATPAKPARADAARMRSEQVAPAAQKAETTLELSTAESAAWTTVERSKVDKLQQRAHWRISKAGQLERRFGNDSWNPVLADSNVKFQVVAVVGDHVWAGGSAGSLYHSANNGESWTKIPVDTTEAITQIQFRDLRSGVVTTESGATWDTSDGGAHWTKK